MKQEYINFYKQIEKYKPTKILHIGGYSYDRDYLFVRKDLL